MALQIFGVIRLQPKFRTLTKCHTEKRRVRRVIKTRHWQSRRHRWCVERRRQFAYSISNLYKTLHPKRVIRNLYATPLLLFVSLHPPCHCLYLRHHPSLCVPYYIRVLVYHSIFRKNLKEILNMKVPVTRVTREQLITY